MRVLFTTHPGSGHFHPLVPLAQALRDAGHDIAFASARSFQGRIEASGFRAFRAGAEWPTDLGFPGTPPDVPPWAVFIVHYAREMAQDLVTLSQDWAPDLIVRDGSDYGGCVAAEHLGVPHASVPTGAWHADYHRRRDAVEPLDSLRADFSLPPDPEVAMPFRYLNLAFLPPRYYDPDRLIAPTTHFLRPVIFDRSGSETLPPSVPDLPNRTTVYATLGTLFNVRTGLFDVILAALRDEPIELIVTVGREHDPARFGPQPPNVHIERYLPQSLIFPRCDLILAHAGFGTVIGALSHGLPLVALNLGADHPVHAGRCSALAVGRVLDQSLITPEAIREAVRDVLADPMYRRNAERLRDEMADLPGLDRAVQLVEQLARDRTTILASP